MKQIRVIYYSATGNTRRIVEKMVEGLQKRWAVPVKWAPYTTPEERAHFGAIEEGELIVWGTPVYAGKTPNKLRPFIEEHLQGCGNPTLLVSTFGNRGYDNALAEMAMIAATHNLRPIGAVAMAMPHAFDGSIGEERPTTEEWGALERYVAELVPEGRAMGSLPGSGDAPYYRPLREDLSPAQFLKAVPQVDEARCCGCGECVSVCPMGSVRMSAGGVVVEGVCIKCGACIKGCRQGALSITDEDYQSHVRMLKAHCQRAAENVFF